MPVMASDGSDGSDETIVTAESCATQSSTEVEPTGRETLISIFLYRPRAPGDPRGDLPFPE